MMVFRPQSLLARVLAVSIALSALLPLSSQAAAPADGQDAAMIAALEKELARPFLLPREMKLDPALRAEAEAIATAHMQRVAQLLPAWLAEEKRAQAPFDELGPGHLFSAVFARLLNEFALWHLDTGDADYEQATLDVLKESPQTCRIEGEARIYDYAFRIQRLQAMPAARHKAMLAAERELLARWGKPRAAPPPWPHPLPQDAAVAALAGIRSGASRPLPLIPMLASNLLAKEENYGTFAFDGRCALQQWWLRVSLTQGVAPAAALSAFRYGTLMTATARFDDMYEAATYNPPADGTNQPPPYPGLARRFEVEGSTTLVRKLDAAGKPVEASVVSRDLTVRGIRGVRPVAFEDAFDAVSVQYALRGGGAVPGAPLPQRFAMQWSLQSSRPAAGTPAKKTGGKQQ
jgi:hypothetical protein